MRGPIELVLFDLGNTLLHDDPSSWPEFYERAERALWESLRASGAQIAPEILYDGPNTLLQYYYALRGAGLDEPGSARTLRDLLASHGESLDDAAVERAVRAMYAVTQANWRLERDALPTLRMLRDRGFRLGALSNVSDDRNVFELLDRDGLTSCFELVLTSAAHGRRKPDPSIFHVALERLAVPPDKSVMIGDSYEADILGAHGIGMSTIWITRRLPNRRALQPGVADAMAPSLKDIPPLLP